MNTDQTFSVKIGLDVYLYLPDARPPMNESKCDPIYKECLQDLPPLKPNPPFITRIILNIFGYECYVRISRITDLYEFQLCDFCSTKRINELLFFHNQSCL